MSVGTYQYSLEERQLARFIRWTDYPGVVALAGVFLLCGDLYRPTLRPVPEDFQDRLSLRTFLSWVCALLAGHALYLDLIRQPAPSVASMGGEAGVRIFQYFGRNVYLTRHCLVLQFVHLFFSALAETLALVNGTAPVWLLNACYGNALFISALASFVTVQYFNLVSPDSEFLRDCEVWAARGVPQKWIQDWKHTWALPLAFADLLLVKQRGLLLARIPPAHWVALAIAIFATYYLLLVNLNKLLTGEWPYAFLSGVQEKGLVGWLGFWIVQTSILVIFMLLNWMPIYVAPGIL